VWSAGSNGDAQLGLGPEPGIKNTEFRLVRRLKGDDARLQVVRAFREHAWKSKAVLTTVLCLLLCLIACYCACQHWQQQQLEASGWLNLKLVLFPPLLQGSV
jgi:hypothetical protein